MRSFSLSILLPPRLTHISFLSTPSHIAPPPPHTHTSSPPTHTHTHHHQQTFAASSVDRSIRYCSIRQTCVCVSHVCRLRECPFSTQWVINSLQLSPLWCRVVRCQSLLLSSASPSLHIPLLRILSPAIGNEPPIVVVVCLYLRP